MAHITIPGLTTLSIDHLVLDYNGTLAVDGQLRDGVAERLTALSRDMAVHILTADTFGTVTDTFRDLPCTVSILEPGCQDQAKLNYVKILGAGHTACIGNGRNDHLMLKEAALGIAVILDEGAAAVTLLAADMVTTRITDALDLLLKPKRLVAGLRC
ncbi:HAD family hydrolase [Desulfatiferula olefinivorans]